MAHNQDHSQPIDTAVLRRLKRIEEHLGLPEIDDQPIDFPAGDNEMIPHNSQDPTLDLLRPTIQSLKSSCSANVDSKIWTEALISQLWLTYVFVALVTTPANHFVCRFHDTMLGLHFMPSRQTFVSPTPLLLASMLYCSSARGSLETTGFAAEYLKVLYNAIAQLCIPGNEMSQQASDPTMIEKWPFQAILGIILAGLLREGVDKETGIWISVAYRLLLEHCPTNVDERSLEWQRLFSGLQVRIP